MNSRTLPTAPAFVVAAHRFVAAATLLLGVLAAQEPTCRLEGQLLDAMQQPLAGAKVIASRSGNILARTDTDAAGGFVFEALPQDRVCVQATTAAPDIAAADIDLLYETTRFLFLHAMPARVVRGFVKNTQGTPIVGAFVGAVPDAAGKLGPVACSATSDEDGAFVLTHVPFGACLLRAFAPGHASYADSLTGTGDLQPAIALDETDAQTWTLLLSGVGFDRTAANVSITAWRGEQSLPMPPQWLAPPLGDDGWHIDAPAASDRLEVLLAPQLAAEPQRHSVAGGLRQRRFPFAVRTGDEAILQLLFEGITPPRPLRVLLQEVGDAAIPARLALAVPTDGKLAAPAFMAPGESFAVRLLDEQFVAIGDGDSAWFTARHQPGATHTVRCEPARTVRVRVVDAEGAPCPGASIELRARGQTIGVGATTRAGTEQLRGLRAAKNASLYVRSARGFSNPPPLPEAQPEDYGTVVLQQGCDLLVLATDADGKPASGARITLRTGSHDTACVAGRDGRFLRTGLVPPREGRRTAGSLLGIQLYPLGGGKVFEPTRQGTMRLEATVVVP